MFEIAISEIGCTLTPLELVNLEHDDSESGQNA
jgi:hypothetical protein